MRALKVLVVVMGVALVAGTLALIAAIVDKVEHRGSVAAVAARATPFQTALPAGSRIVAAEFSGDRMLVHVALAGGGEALYLFDARTGVELGVVAAPSGR